MGCIIKKCGVEITFLAKSLLITTLMEKEVENVFERIEDSIIWLEIIEDCFYVECDKNQCQFRVFDYQRTRERLLDLKYMKQ